MQLVQPTGILTKFLAPSIAELAKRQRDQGLGFRFQNNIGIHSGKPLYQFFEICRIELSIILMVNDHQSFQIFQPENLTIRLVVWLAENRDRLE